MERVESHVFVKASGFAEKSVFTSLDIPQRSRYCHDLMNNSVRKCIGLFCATRSANQRLKRASEEKSNARVQIMCKVGSFSTTSVAVHRLRSSSPFGKGSTPARSGRHFLAPKKRRVVYIVVTRFVAQMPLLIRRAQTRHAAIRIAG